MLVFSRFRLGIKQSPVGATCTGYSQQADCFGYHALCCKSLGVYGRHNCVRNALAQIASEAGLHVQLEVSAPNNGIRPADILVTGLDFSPCALDCTVVHELQPSLSFATMTAVASVHVEETRKRESFGRLHRQRAWTFVPLVVNTSGKWGRCVRGFMQSLVRYRSLKFGTSAAAEAASCWSAVNHALAAAVARQLERAFPSTQAPRGHV